MPKTPVEITTEKGQRTEPLDTDDVDDRVWKYIANRAIRFDGLERHHSPLPFFAGRGNNHFRVEQYNLLVLRATCWPSPRITTSAPEGPAG